MGTYLIDTNIIADYLGARLPLKSLDKVHKLIDSNPFTSVLRKHATPKILKKIQI